MNTLEELEKKLTLARDALSEEKAHQKADRRKFVGFFSHYNLTLACNRVRCALGLQAGLLEPAEEPNKAFEDMEVRPSLALVLEIAEKAGLDEELVLNPSLDEVLAPLNGQFPHSFRDAVNEICNIKLNTLCYANKAYQELIELRTKSDLSHKEVEGSRRISIISELEWKVERLEREVELVNLQKLIPDSTIKIRKNLRELVGRYQEGEL